MTDLNRIVDALIANKIAYNHRFERVRIAGYDSDECQRLSEEILSLVEQLIVVAINNGNSEVNAAINELTDIAVKQSEKGAARKVAVNTAKKNNIISQLDRHQRMETDMEIKQNTIKYIDDAINAITIVSEVVNAAESKENLSQAKARLEIIKGNVSEVWDVKSKAAIGYMGEMLNRIKSVILKVSCYSCDLEGLDYLNEAIELSERWKKLNTAPKSKRDIADEKYINEQWQNGNDGHSVERIKQSVYVSNQIYLFVGDLNSYKDETQRLCGGEKLTANIEKRSAKIEQLKNEAKSASIKLRNNELSKDEATRIVARCKAEMDDTQKLLIADENRLTKMDKLRRARERHAEECESLVDEFLFYEKDPIMLAAIAKAGNVINFDEIRAMIMGHLTEEKCQEVKRTISMKLAVISANKEAILEGTSTWDELNSDLQESIFESTPQETNEQDIDEMLREMGITEEKPEKKIEAEEEIIDGTIVLNENDK